MTKRNHQTLAIADLILEGEGFATYALHPPKAFPFGPHPAPVVIKAEGKFIPVTGHDRLLGAKKESIREITAAVEEGIDPGDGLALSARDIAWERPLTDSERVTAVGKHADFASGTEPHEGLAAALGLEATRGIFDAYARVWRLGDDAVDDLRQGRLSLNCALAVIDAPKQERKALIDLFTGEVQPNLNTARRIVENSVAAALVRSCSVEGLLTRPEIAAVLKSKLDGPKKIAALDRALRQLRYPELSAAEEQAARAIADLRLPKEVTVSVPPNLEPGKITVTIKASTIGDLEEKIEEISKRLRKKKFTPLFQVAGK